MKQNHLVYCYFKLLAMTFRVAPLLFISAVLFTVIEGVSFGALALFQQRFFDQAADLVSGDVRYVSVLAALAWYMLVLAGYHIVSGLGNFIPQVWVEKTQGRLSNVLHSKLSKLPAITFEDADKLDEMSMAVQGKNNAVEFVFSFLIIFSFHLPYFIVMSTYLFTRRPILALAVLFVFLPTLAAQLLRAKVFSKMEHKSTPIRREYKYYQTCLAGKEYYKETRLLGCFRYFMTLLTDCLLKLHKLSFRETVKANMAELSMKLLAVAGYLGILYLLFDSLMERSISVGVFAAVFTSIGSLFGIMEDAVCTVMGSISRNWGTIQSFVSFLEIEERNGRNYVFPQDFSIHLQDVSFAYPNAQNHAVEGINLTLRRKETIAIVGENGSGKSTLIKLIVGLYRPTKGCVCFDEIDCSTLSQESVFSRTSAVFQQYQRYQMTLKENIIISRPESCMNQNQLDRACQSAEVEVQNQDIYPDHYNTILSKDFDGVELSGGQWQRVAIARGLFREHSVIVLDEPTASIDPIEETRLYRRFAEISKNKLAMIVTHRLGAAKLADRIVVMKKGQVQEIGTHQELMERKGEYCRMYHLQKEWY